MASPWLGRWPEKRSWQSLAEDPSKKWVGLHDSSLLPAVNFPPSEQLPPYHHPPSARRRHPDQKSTHLGLADLDYPRSESWVYGGICGARAGTNPESYVTQALLSLDCQSAWGTDASLGTGWPPAPVRIRSLTDSLPGATAIRAATDTRNRATQRAAASRCPEQRCLSTGMATPLVTLSWFVLWLPLVSGQTPRPESSKIQG